MFAKGQRPVAPLVRQRNRSNVESVFKQLAEFQGYNWEEYTWSNVSHDHIVQWAKEKLKQIVQRPLVATLNGLALNVIMRKL